MEKKNIKDLLSEFRNAIEKGTAEINIMMVDQNNQRKSRYKGMMLKTRNEDIVETLI